MNKNSGVLIVNYNDMDSSEKSDEATLVVGQFQDDNSCKALSHFHGDTAAELYETLTTGKKPVYKDLSDRYYGMLHQRAIRLLHENSIYGMAGDLMLYSGDWNAKRILNSVYGIRSPYTQGTEIKPLIWHHNPNDKPIAKFPRVEWHPETGIIFNVAKDEDIVYSELLKKVVKTVKTKVVLLGSLSQLDELNEIAKAYRDAGNLVIVPSKSKSELKYTIRRLLARIKEADLIVVLNKPNNQPLGDGVTYEVEFARSLDKKIIYIEPKKPGFKHNDSIISPHKWYVGSYTNSLWLCDDLNSFFERHDYIDLGTILSILGITDPTVNNYNFSWVADNYSGYALFNVAQDSCNGWYIYSMHEPNYLNGIKLTNTPYNWEPTPGALSNIKPKEAVDTRSNLEKECGNIREAVSLCRFRIERKYKTKIGAKLSCWMVNSIAAEPYGISVSEFCKRLDAKIPYFNYINPDEYRWYGKDSFEVNHIWPNDKLRYEILPTKMPVKVCK